MNQIWGGMVEFEFKRHYKLQRAAQQTTLGHLRIELLHAQTSMNPDPFDLLKSKVLFEHIPELLRDLWSSNMATPEEAVNINEMTTEEVTQAIIVGNAPERTEIVAEIPKSLCMPRPKKDKKPMIPVCMSPRNPLRTKLTMEEKGKVVNVETNEEEEDLEVILVEEEEDEEMKEETKGVDPPTRLPMYVPLRKRKENVPKDLDERMSSL